MQVTTTRFGETERVEVSDDQIFVFTPGLPGFPEYHRYARIVDDASAVEWLQSLDDPALFFPMLEPFLFYPEYGFELPDREAEDLGLTRAEDATVRCILTLYEGVEETTANLLAPLVLHEGTRRGRQIVLQDSSLPMRFEVFEALSLPASA